MINKATVSSYCKDDIRLIENYEQAVADLNSVWHCHHRLEDAIRSGAKPIGIIDLCV